MYDLFFIQKTLELSIPISATVNTDWKYPVGIRQSHLPIGSGHFETVTFCNGLVGAFVFEPFFQDSPIDGRVIAIGQCRKDIHHRKVPLLVVPYPANLFTLKNNYSFVFHSVHYSLCVTPNPLVGEGSVYLENSKNYHSAIYNIHFTIVMQF
jgi:hypothetical protein